MINIIIFKGLILLILLLKSLMKNMINVFIWNEKTTQIMINSNHKQSKIPWNDRFNLICALLNELNKIHLAIRNHE